MDTRLIVIAAPLLIAASKNNPFYWLSNCDLSIGLIPITSLSKLLVGVKSVAVF